MSARKERIAKIDQLKYLSTIYDDYRSNAANAKREAMRLVELQLLEQRKKLAEEFWKASQIPGVSMSNIEHASGVSRPTVYRLVQEHIDNTGGKPEKIVELIKKAKLQSRFVFSHIDDVDRINLKDTHGKIERCVFILDWQGRWAFDGLGYADMIRDEIPEFDSVVEMFVEGDLVPESELHRVDPAMRKKMNVQLDIAENESNVDDVPSFDAWE
jgi:predicted DNA-binding transcriptional regulator AlpA